MKLLSLGRRVTFIYVFVLLSAAEAVSSTGHVDAIRDGDTSEVLQGLEENQLFGPNFEGHAILPILAQETGP